MVDVKDKYRQALDFFGKDADNSFELFMVAICLTVLGRYLEARHFYSLALDRSLGDRFWRTTNQPNRLVDIYVMANQPSLYPQVLSEVESFSLNHGGRSHVELYASALLDLLANRDEEAKDCMSGLLNKPKVKDTFAIGKVIQSIIERDQSAFDTAIDHLLKAHHGMAKFGGLRESPEGFLCLPAMSLSKIARQRGLEVNVESEYLSKGYLDYLLSE